jgi:hypothetical protein
VKGLIRRQSCFWHNSVQRTPALVLGSHLPSYVREHLPRTRRQLASPSTQPPASSGNCLLLFAIITWLPSISVAETNAFCSFLVARTK